jgi:Fe-S oxidoreductase
MHSTRGRANVLRLAMTGRLAESGLGDEGVHEVLDLCLECRACKVECPVGVDMARFKSEFLADYYRRHGTPLSARMLGNARMLAEWGSRTAPLSNWIMESGLVRRIAESVAGIDARRALPRFEGRTLSQMAPPADDQSTAVLFNDTFTNYYEPAIGLAALEVLKAAGVRAGLARHGCCGRPQISKGLLGRARAMAAERTRELHPHAAAGRKLLFCEPSCLSAMREDVPSLLRGEARARAEDIAKSCMLVEEYLESIGEQLPLKARSGPVLLHGHCHQKAMGAVAPVKALLSRIPGAEVVDLDAGCCGMAGSFGYMKDHFEVSRAIGERKLFPAIRAKAPGAVVVAAGTSCRHQVLEFTGIEAVHPAVLLRSLL